MPNTKTSKAVSLYQQGDLKGALKIFSTFKLGFSKQEKDTVKIAYECLTGNTPFYSSLGHDCEQVVAEAKSILQSKYNL